MKSFCVDELKVYACENRTIMGELAAKDISAKINELLATKPEINMIFAAAPSQNDVLKSLAEDKTIDWTRVNAYHMDEYIGLDKDAPQGFGNFLKEHIFGKVPFQSVNYIDITAADPEKEAERYGKLLKANPTDIVVMGIGENGHIAFNDPPADFDTEAAYKVVTLDERCRKQQVGEGWFATIDDVPKQAISMCVKQIMSSRCIVTVVPHAVKAEAIKNTLAQDINNMVPATSRESHPHWDLYLDADSAAGFLKL